MRLLTAATLCISIGLAYAADSDPQPLSRDAVSGCGKIHAGGVTTYHTVKSGGRNRKYSVHVPFGYQKNKEYPVIVGFHGSSSIGFFFEADTGLDSPRFTPDRIMVYPNGVNGSWAGPSYHTATTVNQDLQLVSDLLMELDTEFCIDDSRIYATGISNGGGFVGTLACNDTIGGQFAAFAPASGSFYTDAGPTANDGCTPARSPLPFLEFHGGADQTVNYSGGQGEGGTSHQSWTGCPSGLRGTSVTRHQHYKVDDMKHDWPSTEPNFSQLAAGDKPTHIEASAIIQKFFDAFVRPS